MQIYSGLSRASLQRRKLNCVAPNTIRLFLYSRVHILSNGQFIDGNIAANFNFFDVYQIKKILSVSILQIDYMLTS